MYVQSILLPVCPGAHHWISWSSLKDTLCHLYQQFTVSLNILHSKLNSQIWVPGNNKLTWTCMTLFRGLKINEIFFIEFSNKTGLMYLNYEYIPNVAQPLGEFFRPVKTFPASLLYYMSAQCIIWNRNLPHFRPLHADYEFCLCFLQSLVKPIKMIFFSFTSWIFSVNLQVILGAN